VAVELHSIKAIQSVPHAGGANLDEPQSALSADLAYFDHRDFGMVVLEHCVILELIACSYEVFVRN
jgi:hypothetical protein